MSRLAAARRPSALALLLSGALVLGGCKALAGTPPPPSPADFAGVVSFLSAAGIGVQQVRTGDTGCTDPKLVGPAISLQASGVDQATPVALHLYMFKNQASYEALRSSVDACARSYVTDPATYETVESTPFVAVGQGPWAPGFTAALRSALDKAAGVTN
jgi:hypothetical protein